MSPEGEFLKGCTETIVLTLLAERAMYGYEIVQEIARRSKGLLPLGQGTVYPLLYALERKGYVRAAWQAPADGGRRRKYYSLKKKGADAAVEDRSQWAALVKAMKLVLGGGRARGAAALPG